jgi:hypothetical protein
MAAALLGIVAAARIGRALPVGGRQHDLEFVQFVPFGIGTLPLGYGKERLHARPGRSRLGIVHTRIIASSAASDRKDNGAVGEALPPPPA